MENNVNYRQLSSPDQLDQLIKLTPNYAWLGWLGIFVVFISIVFWGLLGRIDQTIKCGGRLQQQGGVFTIVASYSGQLALAPLEVGSLIKKGQSVAVLNNSELHNKFNYRQEQLQDLIRAQRSIALVESEQTQFAQQRIEADIYAAQSELKYLRDRLQKESLVITPYTGRIIEVLEDCGSLVKRGDPLYNIEIFNAEKTTGIKALLFVAPREGQKIEPGMLVKLIPGFMEGTKNGFLWGRVQHVSVYPASYKGMMRVFKNDTVVRYLLKSGPKVEVTVVLERDAKSKSGYKWSAHYLRNTEIKSEAMCQAFIVTNSSPPIKYLLPMLRRW